MPRATDMAVCFGRNCKGRCRVHWLRPLRSSTCMPWEIQRCPQTCQQSGGKMMVPDHLGRFALISETREEKIGQISGMGPIKWRWLNKSNQVPAAASVRELKTSSSGGKGRNSGRRGMTTKSHGMVRENGRTRRSTPSRGCSINPAPTIRCFRINLQIIPPGNAPGRRAWQGVKDYYPHHHQGLHRSLAQMLCLCLLGSCKLPRRAISRRM